MKRGGETVGAFPYDQVLEKLRQELDQLIERKRNAEAGI
jgi:hypothetical protein